MICIHWLQLGEFPLVEICLDYVNFSLSMIFTIFNLQKIICTTHCFKKRFRFQEAQHLSLLAVFSETFFGIWSKSHTACFVFYFSCSLNCFLFLRHCWHSRMHGLTDAQTHRRTNASFIALITRKTKKFFFYRFIKVAYFRYHFLGMQKVSDQTKYTDRILNNSKMAQAS